MTISKEIKENLFQSLSLVVVLFTLHLAISVLVELRIGLFWYITEGILSIFLHAIGWGIEAFAIYSLVWDIWKKIPIGLHIPISLVYAYIIARLFPTYIHIQTSNYEKNH